MADLMDRLMWGGGRIRTAIVYGLPFGAVMIAMWYSEDGRLGPAVAAGTMAGAFFGAWMAVIAWSKSPELATLPPVNRLAVLRSARHGTPKPDPWLASIAAQVADRFATAKEEAERRRGIMALLVPAMALYAVNDLGKGHLVGLVWALLAVALAVVILRVPRDAATARRNAERVAGWDQRPGMGQARR